MSTTSEQEQPRKDKKDLPLLSAASFLRDSKKSQLKCHEGIENEIRVTYFKGNRAVEALLQPAYKSVRNATMVRDRQEAVGLCQKLLDSDYFHRSIRQSAKYLERDPTRKEFSEDAYYTWDYQGSQTKTILLGILLLVFALGCVMFPIWPISLRLGVWYLSVTGLILIGILFAIALVRWVIFSITRLILPPGFYIFPNLFEDVSFVESFKPVWAWAQQETKKAAVSSAPSRVHPKAE
jgi:translocation protein SEC62